MQRRPSCHAATERQWAAAGAAASMSMPAVAHGCNPVAFAFGFRF